jgi:hypothetical protein
MSSAAFEPAILAVERFQTYGLDRIASEVGDYVFCIYYYYYYYVFITYVYYVFSVRYWGAFETKMNKYLLTK